MLGILCREVNGTRTSREVVPRTFDSPVALPYSAGVREKYSPVGR